jgi:hypothetical protein
MRLMAIISLLQEWVDGAVAYHAAVHSDLRSLEAIAAACDSMGTLLLIQAVCTRNTSRVSLIHLFNHRRISGRNQGQSNSSGRGRKSCDHHAELPRSHISGALAILAARLQK